MGDTLFIDNKMYSYAPKYSANGSFQMLFSIKQILKKWKISFVIDNLVDVSWKISILLNFNNVFPRIYPRLQSPADGDHDDCPDPLHHRQQKEQTAEALHLRRQGFCSLQPQRKWP